MDLNDNTPHPQTQRGAGPGGHGASCVVSVRRWESGSLVSARPTLGDHSTAAGGTFFFFFFGRPVPLVLALAVAGLAVAGAGVWLSPESMRMP